MRLLLLFIVLLNCLSIFGQTQICENPTFQFEIPNAEFNCMRLFNAEAVDVHPVNVYLLAKMTEMLYQERLDYQIRYLRNDSKPVTTLPSTKVLKQNLRTTDEHYECAFAARFSHYFFEPRDFPGGSHQDSLAWVKDKAPSFRYLYKSHLDTLRFLGISHYRGLDPEFVIVSTQDLILILFRGTDDVGSDKISEWTGTDFKIPLSRAGGSLTGTKIHKGFWESFDLIRDDLLKNLYEVNAMDKKIWIAGHSLGGAMSIISAAYLKASGFPVQNAYSFAGPRTIGNKSFVNKVKEILPDQIHRFEYYLDPVPLLWSPLYTKVGKRHWYDHSEKSNYKFYQDIEERYISANPLEFNRKPFNETRTKEEMRLHRSMMDGLIIELPIEVHNHNPPWYVKAAHQQLTEAHKLILPAVEDTFPYIYYGKPGSK